MTSYETLAQWAILILSTSAILLIRIPNKHWKWGYFLGLLAQPFWFYAAWKTSQWGIFFLDIVYTYDWVCRLYNNTMREPKKSD